jgi:hypothetical protein
MDPSKTRGQLTATCSLIHFVRHCVRSIGTLTHTSSFGFLLLLQPAFLCRVTKLALNHDGLSHASAHSVSAFERLAINQKLLRTAISEALDRDIIQTLLRFQDCKPKILWLHCSHCVQPQLSFSALSTPRAGLQPLHLAISSGVRYQEETSDGQKCIAGIGILQYWEKYFTASALGYCNKYCSNAGYCSVVKALPPALYPFTVRSHASRVVILKRVGTRPPRKWILLGRTVRGNATWTPTELYAQLACSQSQDRDGEEGTFSAPATPVQVFTAVPSKMVRYYMQGGH